MSKEHILTLLLYFCANSVVQIIFFFFFKDVYPTIPGGPDRLAGAGRR
jgi:hypothetical protein